MKKHWLYYLTFIAVELCGLLAVFYFAYDKFMRIFVVILMALFYIFWSILHHRIHHDATAKIVIEYILIGILGVVIVLFFLQ
jgi:hypothetical protein